MRKIIFANRKGGSGKTSLVVNLAYNLARRRKKVLVVDLDSQAHSSFYLSKDFQDTPQCLYHYFKDQFDLSKLIQKTAYRNLSLLPSSPKMAELNELIRERVPFLDEGLSELKNSYDFILFDLPPSIEKIVLAGLVASEEVIIPLQTHFFPMQGIAQLVQMIYDLKKQWDRDLKISGIVPTLYDPRTRIYKQVIEEIRSTFGEKMILPGIPYDIKLAEAPSFRKPVQLYSKNCRASRAFDALTQKIIRMT